MGRIEIAEDFDHGPGWVVISVAADGGAPRATSVSIQRRASDKPHLGPSGWQTQEHWLTPAAIEETEHADVLRYGPAVTAHVAYAQDLTITIAPLGLAERHFWPAIAAPSLDARGTFVAPRGAAPDLGRERDLPGPKPLGSGDPSVGIPTEHSAAEPEASAAPTSDRGSRRGALLADRRLLAGGIAVLVLLVLAAYVLTRGGVPSDRSERAAAMPPASDPSLLERYDRYRLAGGEAEALLGLGQEALAAGDTDLATRAISLAATRGSAAADLTLGKWYDPAEPRILAGPAAPDSAALYYKRAAASGNAEAAEHLARLCQRATAPSEAEINAFENFQFETYCN
jgi:hypothetical protein